jgi:hypothetical protein
MNLLKYSGQMETVKEFKGLFHCKFKHEIKATTADFVWDGPKFGPSEWAQTLAFFKWTFDTMHSESQVRWFVHPVQRVWTPWAFPQEARTGMSAREIHPHPLLDEQRAQFKTEEGWVYNATGHHHCNASAFQSGVDEANERNQDGFHYTIGNMGNGRRYDIHFRYYCGGYQFNPSMDKLWDIGDQARAMFPEKFWDEIARWQMSQPIHADFPEVWKTNVIEVKPTTVVTTAGGGQFSRERPSYLGNDGTYHYSGGLGYTSAGYGDHIKVRAAKCVKDIIKEVAESPAPWTAFLEFIGMMKEWNAACDKNDIADIIWNNMRCYRIDHYEDLLEALPSARKMAKLYNKAVKNTNFAEVALPAPEKGEVDEPEDVSTSAPNADTPSPSGPTGYDDMD